VSTLENSVIRVLTEAGAANPYATFLELRVVFEGHGYQRPPEGSHRPASPEVRRRYADAIRSQLADGKGRVERSADKRRAS
jgi:hypothetical protein